MRPQTFQRARSIRVRRGRIGCATAASEPGAPGGRVSLIIHRPIFTAVVQPPSKGLLLGNPVGILTRLPATDQVAFASLERAYLARGGSFRTKIDRHP